MIRARRAATRHRFSDSSRGEPVPMSVTSESPPSSSSVRNTHSAFHTGWSVIVCAAVMGNVRVRADQRVVFGFVIGNVRVGR